MASRQFFERVGRVGDARSLDLAQVKLEVRLVRDGELDHANAISRRSELLVLLEVGITRGNEEHAIEPELIGHATRDDKMPVVHGIEGPAHDANAFVHVLASNLSLTAHEILDRREGHCPHGATRMELLGAYAYLGPETKLAPIGETRRGVRIDDGGIDLALETVDGAHVLGDDALGMPRSIGIDMGNRLVDSCHALDADLHVEILGAPILLGCRDGLDAMRGGNGRCGRIGVDGHARAASAMSNVGRKVSATSSSTSRLSQALQTPGRCVFAFMMMGST